jgi:hypothetical protein
MKPHTWRLVRCGHEISLAASAQRETRAADRLLLKTGTSKIAHRVINVIYVIYVQFEPSFPELNGIL